MIGARNLIPGHEDWHFGLFIRHADDTVSFDIFGPGNERLEVVPALRSDREGPKPVSGHNTSPGPGRSIECFVCRWLWTVWSATGVGPEPLRCSEHCTAALSRSESPDG